MNGSGEPLVLDAKRLRGVVEFFHELSGPRFYPVAHPVDVLRLWAYEGLRVRRIARRLMCSRTTVNRRLSYICKLTGVSRERLTCWEPSPSLVEQCGGDSRVRDLRTRAAVS